MNVIILGSEFCVSILRVCCMSCMYRSVIEMILSK